jgi:hypothetical protein
MCTEPKIHKKFQNQFWQLKLVEEKIDKLAEYDEEIGKVLMDNLSISMLMLSTKCRHFLIV